ncbi:MAG: hypothetical protein HY000_04290 [Planctomycetes bacterium]|nr:hypothetical protein [Planctomycetota bacterium]
MKLTTRKSVWGAVCLGVVCFTGARSGGPQAAFVEDPLQSVALANLEEQRDEPAIRSAGSAVSFIESLIDDAMQDGSISAEERTLILAQARRHLVAAELAQLKTWLSNQTGDIETVGHTVFKSDETKPAPPAANGHEPVGWDAFPDHTGCGSLFDNMYYFAAVEGWQGPVDLGFGNGNFGGRVGVNFGVPLIESLGVGGQFGMSYALYNFHGRSDLGGGEDSAIEDHLMTTFGVFHRADPSESCGQPWSWGVAYDLLYADNIGLFSNEIFIGQWRFQFGYALSATDEIGFWTTQGDESDRLTPLPFHVEPLHQYNMYWQHKWDAGADSRGWFGFAEDPGSLVFGADIHYPLNDCLALVGSAQYILPSARGGVSSPVITSGFAQEFWDMTIGLAYYPGGNAPSKTVAGRRWMPYFNVADNGSFAVEAP